MVRTPPSHGGDREFKSSLAHGGFWLPFDLLKGKPAEIAGLALLLALFLAAVLTSNYWHSMSFSSHSGPAVFLAEYDSLAFDSEQECFTLEYNASSFDENRSANIIVFANNKSLAFEKIKFLEGENKKRVCFDSSLLKKGSNLVEILTHYSTLYYHIEKKTGPRPPTNASITISSVKNGSVQFSVKDFPIGRIAPIEILVNNKLDHRVYPKHATQDFNERVNLKTGQNIITVKFKKAEATVKAFREGRFRVPMLLGVLFLVLSLFVFSCFVFSEEALYKKLSLSLAFTAALLILCVFVLGLVGMLGWDSFTGLFLASLLAIAIYFRSNFSLTRLGKGEKISSIVLLALLVFVFIATAFHLFTYQHMTYWNGFYERMGAMIVKENAIPKVDPLSYFGRGYTFVPGYFYFNAGLSWLSGLDGTQLFALILAFAGMLFFLSIYYFGKSLGLSGKQCAILSLIMLTEGFVLTAVTLSPRHALAFSLFILSLALLFDRKHPLLPGLVLGTAAFIQTPLLAFFPVFAFIAARRFEWKRTLYTILIAGAFFLVLFTPNLLSYGLPYQIESGDWGYLITVPLSTLWKDFSPMLGFFALFYLVDILKKRIRFDSYTKKLFAGVIAGFFIQMFITYRYNILTALNLALLLALWFPVKKLRDVHFNRLCLILIAVTVWYFLSTVNMFSIQGIGLDPMIALKENTSTNARILSDPLFGHSVAYFAQRGVLSDLHVEYADDKKLLDTYRFLEKKDYSVLKKYSIDYTINQSDYINRQAMNGKLSKQPIEYRKLDKIYSNGFIFIHRNREEWK